MKIDVGYVAELARLELTDEEKAVFQPQLENIVKYVEKISSVDVTACMDASPSAEFITAICPPLVM